MASAQPRGARASHRAWRFQTLAVGLAAVAGVCVASRASALILTGGPSYTLPGGGSCTFTGVTSIASGATVTCTGVNVSGHTKVYFGIKNNTSVNGQTMNGTQPASASTAVFRYLSNTANSITYTDSTTLTDVLNGPQAVNGRLVLTLTAGSATIVATGGNPANNANGDIQALFQVTSTSFSVRVDVLASIPPATPTGYAMPAVYNSPNTPSPGFGGISRVDLGFYWSSCGDGVVDSPEQCDQGGANGSGTSCCTSTCSFRASGQTCRAGAGAPCDASETCTGLAGTCPADDAPLNLGVVCRSGSGDVCDANETCTGVPGQGCPADDAPANAGVVCRVGSVGDVCDESELCTGAPGATCPADDAPAKINMVCRAGSGDICDPDERCLGIPGQGCPADVVANPTTVCRVGSGDMCDPSETCTAVPGQPCPSNVVAPVGTTCRAASGQCDVAESCTGVTGQTCPANGFAVAGTSCNADASVCTIDQCDGSNNCVFGSNLDCEDGNVCTQDSCHPVNGCTSVGQPSNSCVSASKSMLRIKDSASDGKDGVKFLWKGGPALAINMGDPTATTRYELCIYDSTGVQSAMGVNGGSGWSSIGSTSNLKGYKYKDVAAASDGIKTIKTKASSLDKGKALVIGKGVALPDTASLPFQFPVTAQLYASDGMCWEASFTSDQAKKNDTGAFIAKQ